MDVHADGTTSTRAVFSIQHSTSSSQHCASSGYEGRCRVVETRRVARMRLLCVGLYCIITAASRVL